MTHVSRQGIKPYRLDRLKSRSVISVVQGTQPRERYLARSARLSTRTRFPAFDRDRLRRKNRTISKYISVRGQTMLQLQSRSECGRLRVKLSGFQALTRLEALHSTGEVQLSQPKRRAYPVFPNMTAWSLQPVEAACQNRGDVRILVLTRLGPPWDAIICGLVGDDLPADNHPASKA